MLFKVQTIFKQSSIETFAKQQEVPTVNMYALCWFLQMIHPRNNQKWKKPQIDSYALFSFLPSEPPNIHQILAIFLFHPTCHYHPILNFQTFNISKTFFRGNLYDCSRNSVSNKNFHCYRIIRTMDTFKSNFNYSLFYYSTLINK